MCEIKSDHMDKNEITKKVLALSIEQWNRSFGGISALDICKKLNLKNEEIMIAMEKLSNDGKGTINANVELYIISFDIDKPATNASNEPTVTHVFFPNKEILAENYYTTDLVRKNYPEYKNRLHKGAHQLSLVYFSDEVLTRYFDHLEVYEIDDSLSGGQIMSKTEAPENRNLYVRYGKRKLKSGKTAVTAIFKDLYVMSDEEQRHWHAYEMTVVQTEADDPNFVKFLSRTYDGAFVNYESPIKDVTETLNAINIAFGQNEIFKRTKNSHFRLPVENTEKSFYDCCSELYKLVGSDSIDQKAIKKYLTEVFDISEANLINAI